MDAAVAREASPPPPSASSPTVRTLEDIALLMRSFERDADAFFFFGASTMQQVEQRIRRLHLGAVPLLRPPIPRRPPVPLDTVVPGTAPPPRALSAPAAVARPPPREPPSTQRAPRPASPPPPPMRLLPGRVRPAPALRMPAEHKPVVVFDTETTGLKPAIVCQLAYVVVENGAVAIEYDALLKLPRGARIGWPAQKVHGISNQDVDQRGVDAACALELFARTCSRVLLAGGRVVAHNASFDARALRETREAHGLVDAGENRTLKVADAFCTMAASKSRSPLQNKAGHPKPFKNEELYAHFYREPPSWARLHNALDDVMVTTLNYAAGLSKGWW